MCVRPDKQNIGIGSQIIVDAIKYFLINYDMAKIFLKVYPDNKVLKLYKRLGFVAKKIKKENIK